MHGGFYQSISDSPLRCVITKLGISAVKIRMGRRSDVAVVWVTNNKRMYTILLIMCMAFRSAARMSIRGRILSG